jgi:hypothetical protein
MYIRVNSHAHWGILARFELKFVGEFQGEKLIDMIESLKSNEESGSKLKGDGDVPVCF